MTTVAAAAAGLVDGAVADARFCAPSDVALAADGTIYVADTGNNAIRAISVDGASSARSRAAATAAASRPDAKR